MQARLLALALFAGCSAPRTAPPAAPPTASTTTPPNVVIVYFDDLGWADWSVQGAQGFETPNIDRLAAEGTRYTDFYVPQPVCTPSRAALLTGSHSMRLGLGMRVLFPFSDGGLAASEETLAEALLAQGYATGCFGKWHLGHRPEYLPTRAGFEDFVGIPYSNDMDAHHYAHNDFQSPPLPLYNGEEIVAEGPDQATFSARFTDAAIEFASDHAEEPFFIYLAQPMPHRPIAASADWLGSSELGLYGDVIQELDAELGRLAAALDELGLADRTLLIVTSDNGPWRRESAGPLRGKKGTTWEGGVRVPCFVRWPGRVPAGEVSSGAWSVMDVAPTVRALAGAPPAALEVDGLDLSAFLRGKVEAPQERTIPFYRDDRLQALRRGRWKLHVHRPQWKETEHAPLLYDLLNDPGESNDLASREPEVVTELTAEAERIRHELGDAVTGAVGSGVRAGDAP